jgi:hypothetical protein
MDDAATLLATTVQQGADTLELGPVTDPAIMVPALFQAAAKKSLEGGRVGWEEGPFFLPNGEQVRGRIYRWGQIAAWGVSEAGEGSLAPAGQEHLQLRREFGRATAGDLAENRQDPVLEVYMFEPERATEDVEKKGGLGATLEEAGLMGQVAASSRRRKPCWTAGVGPPRACSGSSWRTRSAARRRSSTSSTKRSCARTRWRIASPPHWWSSPPAPRSWGSSAPSRA